MNNIDLYESFISNLFKKKKEESVDSYKYEIGDYIKINDNIGRIEIRAKNITGNYYYINFNNGDLSILDWEHRYKEDYLEKATKEEIELYNNTKKYNL